MITVEEFRSEVRQWLADNLVGDYAALKGLGGPGREHEAFEERLAWNRHLAAAGLTCLGWAVEHGGRGLSVAHRVAFYEEYAQADAPDKVNHLGEELVGPTLIDFGTAAQQQRFLPAIRNVTELWCQGYSEPGAGSDLANVSTSAVLDGAQPTLRASMPAGCRTPASGQRHGLARGREITERPDRPRGDGRVGGQRRKRRRGRLAATEREGEDRRHPRRGLG